MVDYAAAFRQGLEAAKAADVARREIDSVFAELNRQMLEASDGKIRVDRTQEYVPEHGFAALAVLVSGKRDTYWAIVAHNPSVTKSPVKELATWSQDRAGYPCKVAFGGVNESCYDRAALENCLAQLLSDPVVGERLSSLMRLEPSPATEPIEGSAQQTGNSG